MAEAAQTPLIVRAWYQRALWLWLLLPLTWLFRLLAALRRGAYRSNVLDSFRASVPVVVIGNISVGGTGKTPLVVALVSHLQREGYTPGVISRGYGSSATAYPYTVKKDDDTATAGDEPLLIARRTQCPVVIDANRSRAAQHLLEEHGCDVIVTDDGLQHYALQRDIECVVVDGQRGFGNGQCLPTGPLREPLSRLNTVDFIISNGAKAELKSTAAPDFVMQLSVGDLVHLRDAERKSVEQWQKISTVKRVHAIAGIGNPARFFDSLRALGFDVIEHAFADHYDYQVDDINFDDDLPVIMTEKDAVKIQPFASDNCWYLSVDADVDKAFYTALVERIKRVNIELK
jgi:tetraacyldisaccharide 4'-kinase